jgi:hypothetical protein
METDLNPGYAGEMKVNLKRHQDSMSDLEQAPIVTVSGSVYDHWKLHDRIVFPSNRRPDSRATR